ncbi:MAG TPA: nucleotidyltransferase domain-containing protein [Candidatus Nanoarchaeia archaeon]|nr:nucleotidyltransferase domain-containing protein [Candidatus Nanoarchaeia archaeon]
MKDGRKNEMALILAILKSPEIEYNANSLAKLLGLSAMGALKIARKLEAENILLSRKVGNAKIYSINNENEYANQYIKLLLKKEIEEASPYVKRWIREIQKIKRAQGSILYGSVLKKEKEAKDIDVLLIVNKNSFEAVKKQVEEINNLNEKKIHPLYQTKEDLKKHIKEKNKVILNALKGRMVSGEDTILQLLCP